MTCSCSPDHIGFINNFQGAVTQYFLPYYCLQQWGMNQVWISVIFAVSGGISIGGAIVGSKMSRRVYERTILTVWQMGNTVTIGT